MSHEQPCQHTAGLPCTCVLLMASSKSKLSCCIWKRLQCWSAVCGALSPVYSSYRLTGFAPCDVAVMPLLLVAQVVHALDDDQQKRLLFFITGSDRVPIKGLGHLSPPFVISRNGSEDSRPPTAHTCFNHLLLPAYRDKETLRQRLLLAIENAEGFGLL
eukprot:GHUV01034231.1.p1 GENE.GHUV01034231.1~~GHUV01034231.1.p1  ORF type:complete len:159 (-),score=19.32 GHUV01034231.1:358-834(-)